MADVYLGLGSNLGDRKAYLRGALDAIAQLPATALCAKSPIYETPPMGPQDQGTYCNMAAKIQTTLEPLALVTALQKIEMQLGRAKPQDRQHWGPREIDIDVLLFDDRVIDEPGLTVPHPGMLKRWFVLKPLADIAPAMIHPVCGQTIETLLAAIEKPAVQGVCDE